MVVGTGIVAETGWTNVCFCTVIRPPEAAAKDCICPNTQLVAAPMPRFGSSWLDAVCRVPKLTSFRIVALIRSGSISRSIARRAGSGAWRLSAGSVSARAVPLSRGTATAVAAEAERNARRVAPPRPRTSLFSMPNIINALPPVINANTQMSTRTAPGQRDEPVASAQGEDDGVQDQPHARAHYRAVDADELQVAAEQQLQLAGRLGGVPPLDGPGDQAGQVVVEVISDGPGARLHHPLEPLVQALVRLQPPPGRHQHVSQPAAQLGRRIGRLGADGLLDLQPDGRGPVSQQRAAQQVALELLAALAQLRVRLEAVGQPGDPRVKLPPGRVAGI